MKICVKCGNSEKVFGSRHLHNHHVVYKPYEEIVVLCEHCHYLITKLNFYYTRIVRRKLNNEDRYEMWDYFLNRVPSSCSRRMLRHLVNTDEYFKKEDYLPLGGVLTK